MAKIGNDGLTDEERAQDQTDFEKSTRFHIDRVRDRLLADGVVTECTHGTSLSDPCADCDIVIDAVLRAGGIV